VTVRLVVVSHDPLARRAVADLVRTIPGVEIAGEMEPESALAFAGGRSGLDAVVWEAAWDGADLRRLSELSRIGPIVVALAATADQARRARAMGAMAVLPRSVDPPALEAALRAALEGLSVSDRSFEHPTLEETEPEPLSDTLTDRERDVLRLVAEGLTNKAIAARLGIRESTVKDHVNSMLSKLGAQSRTEAVTIALRRGLIAI
jgi:DNA-binding NarL/FixJ family response regulator